MALHTYLMLILNTANSELASPQSLPVSDSSEEIQRGLVGILRQKE